ncbi:MAG TPA: Ig-like domain-containing protein, partial [Isosphaeraceae bacterium]|nr:Ig-like domain-containing protein [Isosphaeraceae bacterium]
GVGTGTTDITASLGGVTSPGDTFTVTAAALQSIALTPANPSIAKGLTEQFAATGTYTDGTTANLTTQVTWASATPSVATISPAGLATGVGTGTSDITASLGGVKSPADTLTVNAVSVNAVSVEWGSQTVSLQTASDGVRLLPVGRNTDLPWLNINRIAITLSQAADLNPGDVSVTGITGGNYGPVTISGSGTSNVLITLSKPISAADRVTITIGNAEIITYTRRLDVLPGDVNDDGAVNTTDGLFILYNETPVHAYQAIYDLNGDGAVNATDFTLYRPFIGTVLPGLSPQLAAGGAGPGGAASLTPNELAPVLTEAIDEWAAAGLPARDVARLRGDTVQITTLPVGYLGATAIGGTTVYLSADADGYGWFIDPSHSTNAAFARPIAATELLAAPSTPPAGHEDLLTVVMHELGHTLGLGDLDPAEAPADLMAETLATGVRRLPSARTWLR